MDLMFNVMGKFRTFFSKFPPKGKKGKGLGTCYSAAYTRLEQQRFTISEVAADWHELMIPWRIRRLLILNFRTALFVSMDTYLLFADWLRCRRLYPAHCVQSTGTHHRPLMWET